MLFEVSLKMDKGRVKEKKIETNLKRDGKSHPANIKKRAFGDSWPGFPRNLARYGSEFLAVDSIRSTKLRKERGGRTKVPTSKSPATPPRSRNCECPP